MEGHENPVELALVPLIPVPDRGLLFAVDRDDGLELNYIMLGAAIGPHLVPALRTRAGLRPFNPMRNM